MGGRGAAYEKKSSRNPTNHKGPAEDSMMSFLHASLSIHSLKLKPK